METAPPLRASSVNFPIKCVKKNDPKSYGWLEYFVNNPLTLAAIK